MAARAARLTISVTAAPVRTILLIDCFIFIIFITFIIFDSPFESPLVWLLLWGL
jgi:hypothetical protein